jgi:hypothetical protein
LVATLRKCKYFVDAADPCGGTFRAQGRKSTCSAKCKLRDEREKLRDEHERGVNRWANRKEPKATRICALCKERPVYYRSAMTCLECRDEYRRMMRNNGQVRRYWADPEAARAVTNAANPEKRRARRNRSYHKNHAIDPQKDRDRNNAQRRKNPQRRRDTNNASRARHRGEINARNRRNYAENPEPVLAKLKANKESRERHPRRFKALRKAAAKRRSDRIRRERRW